jgi:hypothetical protein
MGARQFAASALLTTKGITMTAATRDVARSNGARQNQVVRRSTETKAAFKTTEFIAYVAAVVGVIVVAILVKHTSGHNDYFRADKAMFYIVLLTLGYLGSRGLAKSGSHDNYSADTHDNG